MGCWWAHELIQLLWKTVQRFLKKLKIELPYDPAAPVLGMRPKELKPDLEVRLALRHSSRPESQEPDLETVLVSDRTYVGEKGAHTPDGVLFSLKRRRSGITRRQGRAWKTFC